MVAFTNRSSIKCSDCKGARRVKWNWALVAIGILLGGLAATAAIFASRPTTAPVAAPQSATAFYLDGCELRIKAINLRAARRSSQGQVSLDFKAPANWCECTGRVLETNFDADTVRDVGKWFQAVAFGGAERSAEEEYFSQFSLADRRHIESAYDFATRQCNQARGH